jgi:hypothetical protein
MGREQGGSKTPAEQQPVPAHRWASRCNYWAFNLFDALGLSVLGWRRVLIDPKRQTMRLSPLPP